MNDSTVHVLRPKALAPEETERLFAGLEVFVNLGNSYEDYCNFAKQWPTFCPVALRNSSGELVRLLPNKNLHDLVIIYRNFLRLVWRRDAVALREQVSKILLGLANRTVGHEPLADEEEEAEWVPLDTSTPEALAKSQRIREKNRERREGDEERSQKVLKEFDPRIRSAVWALMHEHETGYCRPFSPLLVADWERGELCYEPANDFQWAVYTIFRQSWRARICRECQKLFIAAKHPQMFCRVRCSAAVKLRRNRVFWKNRGTVQRRKRNQESRRSRKKGK
jgi:hypothetical protein